MDKLKEKTNEEKKRGKSRLARGFLAGLQRGTESYGREALIENAVIFIIGILFSRCHLIFSAYPLGVALVSVLPTGVFTAALGSVIGSLTIGRGGVIYAMITVISLFIRLIISGGDRREGSELFGENLLLRMSAATVGGFVSAVYEVLLSGFGDGVILFGITMILVPPAVTFILSGLFSTGIELRDLILGDAAIFSFEDRNEGERYNLVFFLLSSLVALFLISLSLYSLELFGINMSLVFVSAATLVAAKRFGPLYALATGFISALPTGMLAVSFALAGLGAGILFGYGAVAALCASSILMIAWSGYVNGALGILSTVPEYLIAAALVTPFAKNLPEKKTKEEQKDSERSAKDMVGTMALSYQNGYTGSLDLLEASLTSLSSIIRSYSSAHVSLSLDDYRSLVIDTAREHCRSCSGQRLCLSEDICPAVKGASVIAEKLLRGERITPEDVNTSTEFCQIADKVSASINRAAAETEKHNQRLSQANASAEESELISKLINDARARDELEKSMNPTLTDSLGAVLDKHGLRGGIIRAFGSRAPHIILAAEDESGDTVSSKSLRSDIEEVIGMKLGEPEFWRNGRMAMMECGVRRRIAVECATASVAADPSEISGDSTSCFESGDGHFYALLSDGMGRGDVARDTSEFVSKFLTRVLDFSPNYETALHLLNYVMRARSEECSATVDLFSIDLYSGDATFIKSGAAPSFVKREESIFRVKSQTAPLGLVKAIDTERIKVEVRCGDHVILLSDGILESAEDAPWLLELLSKPAKRDLKEYAELILAEALRSSRSQDDMSVSVLRIVPQ